MRVQPRSLLPVARVFFVVTFASCGGDRGTPIRPAPTPATPTVFVVRTEVIAPPEIAPGESVQLTANAIKSDGSVENVTAQARWTPATSVTIDVSAAGVATGKANGEVTVRAEYSARAATARILVLPKGTFKPNGTIREGDVGVDNVRVTVVSGVGQNLTATSGFTGGYVLYGVSGPIRLQTQRDGYVTSLHDLDISGHASRDLVIVPSAARTNYTGEYDVKFSLNTPCRFMTGTIPDVARQRTYSATVTQDGARVSVTLGGAQFVVINGHGRSFSGYIDAAGPLTFEIGSAFYYYYYYGGDFDIAERIDDFTLLLSGTVHAQGTQARLTGFFDGLITTSRSSAKPFRPFLAQCSGTTHGFEMIRR